MSGAFIGGILVGLVETVPLFWLPTEWGEFTLYIVAFLFVIFRPTGLVGASRKPKKTSRSSAPTAAVQDPATPVPSKV
jgi:branched-subunit amino acid ABC-type transport system permease component